VADEREGPAPDTDVQGSLRADPGAEVMDRWPWSK
jgi:hypothetical protein